MKSTQWNSQVERSWDEYNLRTEQMYCNGQPLPVKAIVKNGEYVKFMSSQYHLLPNEEVQKIADATNKRVGASPWKFTTRDDNGWYSGDGHAITNVGIPVRIGLVYTFDDGARFVNGRSDEIQLGYMVQNSINGSAGFGVVPVDIRRNCNNAMFHLSSPVYHGTVQKTAALLKARDNLLEAQVDWNDGRHFKKHSKNLLENDNYIGWLQGAIALVKERGEKLLKRYNEMYEMKVTQKQAEQVAKFSKDVTKELSWLEIKTDGKVKISGDVTQWKAFNDVTQFLSYNNRKSMNKVMQDYAKVDKILVEARR